jgi:predicted Zn-dependent protease
MSARAAQDLLSRRPGVADWETWTTESRESQVYVIGLETESLRRVSSARLAVTVYHDHPSPDGSPARGSASFDLTPSDSDAAIAGRLEEGVCAASLSCSPPWSVPGPAAYPCPETYDPSLAPGEAEAALGELRERLTRAVSRESGIRLSAAEFFAFEEKTAYQSSRGATAAWAATRLFCEGVLLAGEGGDASQAESYFAVARRRIEDFPLEEIVTTRARYAIDGIGAGPPPTGRVPVVVSGEDIARLLTPFVSATSGEAVYNRLSSLKPGDRLLGDRETRGDSVTLTSDGLWPFGVRTAVASRDGLPMGRSVLVREGVVENLLADQKYAAYLKIPPTGGPGNIVLAAGRASLPDLLRGDGAAVVGGPFLHVVAFTDLYPDRTRGDFGGEIRLGYYHEGGPGGRVRPVRGGSVAGNVYEAFADALFSREVIFTGDYAGPRAIRFAGLTVAGE